MKTLNIIVMALLTCTSGILENNKTQLLVDFLNLRLWPPNIATHLCWSKESYIQLANKLQQLNVRYQHLKIGGFTQGDRFFTFAVDMSCESFTDLITQALQAELFTYPNVWIVFGNTSELKASNFYFPINSHVLVATYTENATFDIKNLYKVNVHSTAYIEHTAARWYGEGIFDFNETILPRNRSDMMGTPIRVSYVFENSDSVNHLLDHRHKETDKLSKINYVLLDHLCDLWNTPQVKLIRNEWGLEKDADNNYYKGMLGDLYTGRADIAGTVTFTPADRLKHFRYLVSTTKELPIKFVFRAPPLAYSTNLFALPFDKNIWYSCGFVCALGAVFIGVIMIWENKRKLFDDCEENKPNIWDVVMMQIAIACQTHSFYQPKSISGRIATLTILSTFTYVYVAFSARIVDLLPTTSDNIKNIRGLYESNMDMGVNDNDYNRFYFTHRQDRTDEYWRKLIYEKKISSKNSDRQNFINATRGMKLVQTSYFAFHVELSTANNFIEKTFTAQETCSVRMTDTIFRGDIPHLSTPKNSTYVEIFLVGFRRLFETGIHSREHRHYFTAPPKCQGTSKVFISVGLVECYFPFMVFVAGACSSVFVLFLEYVVSRYLFNTSKVLPKKLLAILAQRIFSRWEIIFPVFLVFPAYGEPTFLDFLVEFIDADGGNLAVNLFECGKSDSVKMAKKFMYHGFLTDAVFIDSVQETFPLRPGRQFFVINLSCNNSINLLNQMVLEHVFALPNRWLAYYKSEDYVLSYVLKALKIPVMVDSDFSLIEIRSDGAARVKKIYKKHKTSDSFEVEEHGAGTNAIAVDSTFKRRHLDVTLNACIVLTHNNSVNHLTDKREKHIDSIAKVNYVLVLALASIYNITLNFSVQPTWGYKNNQSEWNGMMGELVRKEADIGGTSLFFTKDRVDLIDYIAMVTPTKSKFVFRQPKLSYVSNVYTMPFDRRVWLCIAFTIILIIATMYVLAKWEWKKKKYVEFHDTSNSAELTDSLTEIVLVAFGALCQQGASALPYSAPGRIATICSMITLMFIYVSYSANIVALLQTSSNSIRTLEDLLKSRLQVGVDDTVFNHYYFSTADEPIRKAIYERKVAPAGKNPNFLTIEEGVKKVRDGLFAFHMETGAGYKLVGEIFMEHEKCGLQEISYLQVIDPWLAIQKNSSYKEMLKIGLRLLQETGIQERENILIYTKKPACTSKSSTFFSVGIVDCYFVATVLAVGLIASSVILIFEILVHVWIQSHKKYSQEFVN
ncbi:uncharacterized protein LOC132703210 [Cylas formicarius]|uniref:uncharacterized protein LOC132703210 n=1 Tax=Cylas formicarius TaxID=197179 RepID=UPI002958DDC0|nr:uncharacterized protein LOC132703210 [Cylas formicarius]